MLNDKASANNFKKEVYKTLFEVKSITRAQGSCADGWDWRLKNVGKLGLMAIFTFIDGKHEGESVISMVGEANLQTSPGRLTVEGDIITLETKQTVYVFEDTHLLPAMFAGIDDMSS